MALSEAARRYLIETGNRRIGMSQVDATMPFVDESATAFPSKKKASVPQGLLDLLNLKMPGDAVAGPGMDTKAANAMGLPAPSEEVTLPKGNLTMAQGAPGLMGAVTGPTDDDDPWSFVKGMFDAGHKGDDDSAVALLTTLFKGGMKGAHGLWGQLMGGK